MGSIKKFVEKMENLVPVKKDTRARPFKTIYLTKNDPLVIVKERWLVRCTSELTKKSYDRSITLWQHFLGSQEQRRTMLIVSESDAIEFRDWLLSKKMKPGVVRQHMSVVERFYNFAIKCAVYIEQNPFLDVPRPKGESLPKPLIEPPEMRRLLSAPTAPEGNTLQGLRDRAILLLLAKLALRVSDIVKLRNGDFVEQKIAGRLGRANCALRIENAKHGSSAVLPVVEDVEMAIKAYLKADFYRRGPYDKPADPLFQSVRASGRQADGKTARHLSTRAIQNLTQHYADYSGLNQAVSPHSLRRAAITQALDQGATYRQVQNLSRHKRIETVRLYDLRRTNVSENAALILTYGENGEVGKAAGQVDDVKANRKAGK